MEDTGRPYPRISIVTPTYNQAHFLEETICAILSQEYPDLEYLIIDGGSTDGTIDIIKKYEEQLVYWISEQDSGQSEAINKGFARCTGEIITFCNSDDYYLPGTLWDVARAWQASPECGAIVGGFYFIDVTSCLQKPPILPHLAKPSPVDLSLGPPGVYRLHQTATFYTRQALDEVGRYVREDLTYTMDRELLYRVVRLFPVVLRQRPYSVFRLHENSKSVAHILPFAEEFAQLYLMHLSDSAEENGKRQKMANHHRAKGYLKYARDTEQFTSAAAALIKVLKYEPETLFKKSYLARWYHLVAKLR